MYTSFDYYRVFYYVAKYRNFTQAASVLMSNQPNITRIIKNLESELGCTLFVRSNRGVSLTPEGEMLYEHIRIAIEHIEAGEKELSMEKSLKSGTVSIGVSEVALHGLLLPALKDFHSQYPGVRIKISNSSTPQAIAETRNGQADFALVTTPTGISQDMRETPIKPFREIAVCGSAFSKLEQEILTIKDLVNYPIVSLGPKTKTFEFFSEWFAKRKQIFSPEFEAATTDQILPMVKHNLGIGFVPDIFLESDFEKNSVVRLHLEEEIPPRVICLVTKRTQRLSIAAKELTKFLLEYKEEG